MFPADGPSFVPTSTTPSGIANDFAALKARRPYAGNGAKQHQPLTLTSDLWIAQGKRLVMHGGISAASWNFPLRAADETTKGGTSRTVAPKRTGASYDSTTHFSSPTVTLSFQTGNILPLATRQGSNRTAGVPYGLDDFYYFMQLINQPPLMPAGLAVDFTGEMEGDRNYTYVYYSTHLFPNVVLKGYIEAEGISISEEAEGVVSRTWEATMKVHRMSPDISETAALRSAYLDFWNNRTF